MKRKKIRNLLLICIVIAILLSTMIIADFNFVLQGEKPVFCFIKNAYEDGGTLEYVGFGYKIIDYNAIYGRQDVVLGNLFTSYEPRIDESKFVIIEDNKNKTYNFNGKVEKIVVEDGKTNLFVNNKEQIQKIKVIDATLVYMNNFNAKLTDIVVGSTIEVRTSLVDTTKQIPESIAEIINIVR